MQKARIDNIHQQNGLKVGLCNKVASKDTQCLQI